MTSAETEKAAAQVRGEDFVPLLNADLSPGFVNGRERGIVDQHVEATVMGVDLAREPVDLDGLRDVGMDKHPVSAGPHYVLHHVPRLDLTAVSIDDDSGALASNARAMARPMPRRLR